MKLLAIVMLAVVLPLFTAPMCAAGEGPMNAEPVIRPDLFTAYDGALGLRSKMTGINFRMGFSTPRLVYYTTAFSLKSVGMSTEGYINIWDEGAWRISSPAQSGNGVKTLLHKIMVPLLIVCLLCIVFAFVAWRLIRRSVEKSTRRWGIIKSEHDRRANALTRAAHD
jgi:hypothetical protein